MLVTEPIILLLAIYNSFVCRSIRFSRYKCLRHIDGLLYLLFEAFPIAFEEIRGWKPVPASLAFIAVLVGVLISAAIQSAYQPIFWRKLEAAYADGKKNNPEARLPPMSTHCLLIGHVCSLSDGSSAWWHLLYHWAFLIWLDGCTSLPMGDSFCRSRLYRCGLYPYLPKRSSRFFAANLKKLTFIGGCRLPSSPRHNLC